MSMLSAQCDELRRLATRYDELQVGAVRAVKMPPNIGSILREAADTILELRDDLQRANAAVRDAEHDESMSWDRVCKVVAENAKLREENQSIGLAAYELGRKSMAGENAKLRELVRAAWKCIHTGASCSDCRLIAGGCTLQSAMRELEVTS